MSSNHNDINNTFITRDNYEEAFLLYVDDELTAAEKAAVDAFVLLHPDLGEELEMLLSTKLPLAAISLDDKQPLFSESMKLHTVDEALLLYIDNELAPAEQQKVEDKIREDKDYSLQHQLLLKTKLDGKEKISYPNKEELYRKGERGIYAGWWRIAAAAVIILWAGTFDWFGDEAASTSGPVALQNGGPAPAAPVAVEKAPITDPAKNEADMQAKETTTTPDAIAVTENKASANDAAVTNSSKKEAPLTAAVQAVAITTPVVATQLAAVQLANENIAAPQQIINNPVVTSAVTPAYIPTEASHTASVPVDEVTAKNNERGGSLKGFLRKTTRFIERTTNINPVNADDELLIGAISINLK